MRGSHIHINHYHHHPTWPVRRGRAPTHPLTHISNPIPREYRYRYRDQRHMPSTTGANLHSGRQLKKKTVKKMKILKNSPHPSYSPAPPTPLSTAVHPMPPPPRPEPPPPPSSSSSAQVPQVSLHSHSHWYSSPEPEPVPAGHWLHFHHHCRPRRREGGLCGAGPFWRTSAAPALRLGGGLWGGCCLWGVEGIESWYGKCSGGRWVDR